MITIGKIVKSNTHIDYVCQVFNRGESVTPPQAIDYTFGTFVRIDLEENVRLIGVIYNTLLMNPEFGNLGPRLSPRSELEVFSPDYLMETATLVGIIALGWQDAAGAFHQGVPALAATVNNVVQRLTEEELRGFHGEQHGAQNSQVRLRYAQILLGMNNPLVAQLLIHTIDQLAVLFPTQRRQLSVMRTNLAWKAIVEPAG